MSQKEKAYPFQRPESSLRSTCAIINKNFHYRFPPRLHEQRSLEWPGNGKAIHFVVRFPQSRYLHKDRPMMIGGGLDAIGIHNLYTNDQSTNLTFAPDFPLTQSTRDRFATTFIQPGQPK